MSTCSSQSLYDPFFLTCLLKSLASGTLSSLVSGYHSSRYSWTPHVLLHPRSKAIFFFAFPSELFFAFRSDTLANLTRPGAFLLGLKEVKGRPPWHEEQGTELQLTLHAEVLHGQVVLPVVRQGLVEAGIPEGGYLGMGFCAFFGCFCRLGFSFSFGGVG